MSSMMISQATLLHRLQTIDLTIDARNARLQEIKSALEKDDRVAATQKELDAASSALTPWQTTQRNLDLEIKSIAQKIKATEDRLYGGKVSNPKELGEMQNEIGSLKKHQGQLEDEMLEAMLKVEEKSAAVVTAQHQLEVTRQDWKNAQAGLLSEQETLKRQVAELSEKRKAAAVGIDAANLAKYEGLRAKRRGQVVAVLKGDSCGTCGVEQTSMIAQQVRQGSQIVLCANCGRILATA